MKNKQNKNELEKSVTPPYVALLFAKKPQKIIALHYFYYYKRFQKNHLSSGKNYETLVH